MLTELEVLSLSILDLSLVIEEERHHHRAFALFSPSIERDVSVGCLKICGMNPAQVACLSKLEPCNSHKELHKTETQTKISYISVS